MEKNNGLRIFIGIIILVVVAAIITGFVLVGSPAHQRLIKFDQERLNNLSSIRSNIVTYWQQNETLPENLQQLEEEFAGWAVPVDPETGDQYEYRSKGELSFELCAEFALPSPKERYPREYYFDHYLLDGDTLEHDAGRQCFEWTIDKEAYETNKEQIPPRPVY